MWLFELLGAILFVGGIIAVIIALLQASAARKSKSGADKSRKAMDVFFYGGIGGPCVLVGIMFVLPFVFQVSWTIVTVIAILTVAYVTLFLVCFKRYRVAESNFEEANSFDRAVWHMFNGREEED